MWRRDPQESSISDLELTSKQREMDQPSDHRVDAGTKHARPDSAEALWISHILTTAHEPVPYDFQKNEMRKSDPWNQWDPLRCRSYYVEAHRCGMRDKTQPSKARCGSRGKDSASRELKKWTENQHPWGREAGYAEKERDNLKHRPWNLWWTVGPRILDSNKLKLESEGETVVIQTDEEMK
jgi:hypothetical protein